MTGALVRYVTTTASGKFQPMNAAFGLVDSAPGHVSKKARKEFYAQRALEEMRNREAREGLNPTETDRNLLTSA